MSSSVKVGKLISAILQGWMTSVSPEEAEPFSSAVVQHERAYGRCSILVAENIKKSLILCHFCDFWVLNCSRDSGCSGHAYATSRQFAELVARRPRDVQHLDRTQILASLPHKVSRILIVLTLHACLSCGNRGVRGGAWRFAW